MGPEEQDMSDEKEITYADQLLRKALEAAEAFERFDQARVDKVVEALYRAAFNARVELAEAAKEETGIGVLKDKVQKNTLASLIVYRDIKDVKTVGVVEDDPEKDTRMIAKPVGPVLSLTPVTNPTSTVINNVMICMKTRNPVIIAPHRAAKKSSRLAAKLLYDSALEAGAPEGCIQWSAKSKWSYTETLMRHPEVGLILATTAFHFVKEAYRSGNPCLGAGEGNVPVFVDPGFDLDRAARSIVESKTFDNGTVCCSEQCLVVLKEKEAAMRKALERHGGYFCKGEEKDRLSKAVFDAERQIMNSEVVGQPAVFIAKKAGFNVPEGTRLLLASIDAVGPDEPLSHEVLAPVLPYYTVEDLESAVEACRAVNHHHGRGHTLSIYTEDDQLVERFSNRLKAGRILVNTPSSLGGLGGTLNRLHPSLTLSCGGGGGNYTSDNITVHHLLEINRVARPKPDEIWTKISDGAWLDPRFDAQALEGLE